MAARHHWLHAVSVDGETTAVVILKMLVHAVRAAEQAAAVEAAPLLEAAAAAAPAPQYEILRVDQMVVVVWRFYIVAHVCDSGWGGGTSTIAACRQLGCVGLK